jgi:dolichyl-phosphate-mannose--protein O-mannosyl transferase
VDTDFTSDSVTLSLYSGSLKLNEIAFFDGNGEQIPVTLSGATEEQKHLFDEQADVSATPSYFTGMYFDELYHARTAYEHLNNLVPYENSHPPLGKIFIMLGVWAFGMTPFGWRVVGALFGIAMLPVLYAFGKRIFKNSNYALVLTTLFAFDFMHFTQTRIATIDVYSVFFILLMYYYMYQYITMNFYVDGLKKTLKPLALSGLFFGIGAACKWTSIYAGAGLAVLLASSLIARYLDFAQVNARDNDADKARVREFWPLLVKTLLWCVLFFIVIPFAIYFASYTPYYIYESGQSTSYGIAGMFRTFGSYQEFMYSYHSNLNATHPYQSSWYSWPFTVKPMWYYFNSYISPEKVSTLSASGNPAVWWVSAIGAVALLWARLSKRVAPDRAMQIFCVGILANFLPWVLVTRCTFIYHFFATVPFILMATGYALQKLEQKYPEAHFLKWFWVGFAVLFFALLYPGISGLPIPADWAAFLANLPGGKLMYGA